MGESPTQPRAGDVLGNRYRIDALLGRGGMGAAYAATNLVTGKRVAVKWLLRERSGNLLHRTIREARAAGRVRHPNIVDVYDVGEHEGSLFLVMELLSGESLQAVIESRAPLPLDELLGWLLPALRGVREAHRCGVIHRDLKPANIFLCRHDESEPFVAKVLDFGVSKIVAPGEDSGDQSITDSGAVLGTPSYMAPEQLQAARNVDARVDVYACGAVLYHALSGRRPFESDNYAGLAVKILTESVPALAELRPDLPADVCELVHRALSRDPEARLPSVDALIRGLEPHHTAAASSYGGAANPVHRGRGLAIPAVGILVLIAALASWALAQHRQLQSKAPPERRSEPQASAESKPVESEPIPQPTPAEPEPVRAVAVPDAAPRIRVRKRAHASKVEAPGGPSLPAEPTRTSDGDPIIELKDDDF